MSRLLINCARHGLMAVAFVLGGCAFNFELTSQRTALENQILGSYQELDDNMLMISSVRALDEEGKKKDVTVSELQAKALRARQNQEFNRDDIEELKSLQIIGEQSDGVLTILPAGVGLVDQATPDQQSLARLLVKEENHDRALVWQRIIQMNENLSGSDLGNVQRTFAKQIFDSAPIGHWFRSEQGRWYQKSSN